MNKTCHGEKNTCAKMASGWMLKAGYRPLGWWGRLAFQGQQCMILLNATMICHNIFLICHGPGVQGKRVTERTGLFVGWLDNAGYRPPRSSLLYGMFLMLYTGALSCPKTAEAKSIPCPARKSRLSAKHTKVSVSFWTEFMSYFEHGLGY